MTATSLLQQSRSPNNIVRSVSSVAFAIEGENAFDGAVALSAEWMRVLNPAIPREASNGEPFDVGGGGTQPARAVSLNFSDVKIWSSTVDDPDKSTLGRTWITEITVASRNGEAHFGARLLNMTRNSDDPFVPSIPRIVRNIVNSIICKADGVLLRSEPIYINNDTDLEWLVALIENPARKLPVVVMGEAISRVPVTNLNTLARSVCGAAHVVGVSSRLNGEFRKYTGRELAVFDGAVRLFRTNLQFDKADPYSHPLWLPTPGRTAAWGNAAITSHVLLHSINKGTTDYPRFEAVRQAVAQNELSTLRSNSSDAEMARLFEEENSSLRKALDDLRNEHNQWLSDAEADRIAFERQFSEMRAEIHRYKSQINTLRNTLENSGATISREPLDDLANFREWMEENLSPNIWIAPKAIKEVERHGIYRNPQEIGDALFAMDDFYVSMRRNFDSELRLQLEEKLRLLGITISECFSQSGDIKRYPAYSVIYNGEKFWCDLHVKRGGGTDPRNMFRIYFTWYEDEGIIIVGHLPTHLDNNLTN
ncbi:hypothetical protein [Methylobacterium sp. JK268]